MIRRAVLAAIALSLVPLAPVHAADACFSDKIAAIFVITLGLGEPADVNTVANHKIAIIMPEFGQRREYFADWKEGDTLTVCAHPDGTTGNTHLITNESTHETYPGTVDAAPDHRVCLHDAGGAVICGGS